MARAKPKAAVKGDKPFVLLSFADEVIEIGREHKAGSFDSMELAQAAATDGNLVHFICDRDTDRTLLVREVNGDWFQLQF